MPTPYGADKLLIACSYEPGFKGGFGPSNGPDLRSSVRAHTGTYSMRIQSAQSQNLHWGGGSNDAIAHLGTSVGNQGSQATVYLGTWLYVETNPDIDVLLQLITGRSANVARTQLKTNGTIDLYYYTTGGVLTLIGNSGALAAGWNHIELRVINATTTGGCTVALYVNNVEKQSLGGLSVSTATASDRAMYRGQLGSSAAHTGTYYLDDTVVTAGIPTYNMRVYPMYANANGATMQWASGTANSYTEVDEVDCDLATYLAPTTPHEDMFLIGLQSASEAGIPTAGRIFGVGARTAFLHSNSNTTRRFVFRVGGTNYLTQITTGNVNGSLSNYSPFGNYRSQNPYTGADWTYGDLDGIEIGQTDPEDGGNNTHRVSQVFAEVVVEFELPAGAPVDIEFTGFATTQQAQFPAGAPVDIQFEGTVSTYLLVTPIAAGAPGDVQFEGTVSTYTAQVLAGVPGDIQFTGTVSTYLLVTPIAAGAPAEITWQGFTSTIATVDMVVEVSLSNLSGDTDEECGVVFRLGNATNFLAAYVDDGDDLVHLSAFEGGVERSIATAAWTPADTAEIRVICQQERIRVWVDRVLVIDVEDGWLVYANRAGLFSRSTAVAKYSDFYAQLLSEVA